MGQQRDAPHNTKKYDRAVSRASEYSAPLCVLSDSKLKWVRFINGYDWISAGNQDDDLLLWRLVTFLKGLSLSESARMTFFGRL